MKQRFAGFAARRGKKRGKSLNTRSSNSDGNQKFFAATKGKGKEKGKKLLSRFLPKTQWRGIPKKRSPPKMGRKKVFRRPMLKGTRLGAPGKEKKQEPNSEKETNRSRGVFINCAKKEEPFGGGAHSKNLKSLK